jgi:hypothetical protein
MDLRVTVGRNNWNPLSRCLYRRVGPAQPHVLRAVGNLATDVKYLARGANRVAKFFKDLSLITIVLKRVFLCQKFSLTRVARLPCPVTEVPGP